ncbi:MAG: lytic transglycosylase domain-containing protein [Granulosicoccus sp.]
MFPSQRALTGFSRIISFLVLSLVTGTLLGFSVSKDERAGGSSGPGYYSHFEDIYIQQSDDTEDRQLESVIRRLRIRLARPSSLAKDSSLQQVIGKVSSRRWTRSSIYSPDRVIAEVNGAAGIGFRGVGFPDIRTYRKPPKRYDPLKPHLWAPMITWREKEHANDKKVPIARVRCMGLSPQRVARRAERYDHLILRYALMYDISASLIKAVITVESCFRNKALSPAGAQGLMQLMPETASWLGVRNPHSPEQNIEAGIRYLASLRRQFDTLELALAAYNAGPGNVRRYGGVPPFRETRDYVKKVQAHYRRYAIANRIASR